MRQKSITNEEINQFEVDAKQWIRDFCRHTIDTMNSANQQQGMYLRTEVTPYMHKTNHQQVRLFFGGTTMGGGKSKRPAIHDIFYMQTGNCIIKYTIRQLNILEKSLEI
ncbi:hypothetical protein C1646_752872 [Rhizophagus diaphanus]|nr:hypothetical protein C1646_752872 [Rhizophagus diaphanus] [Rhizophagus sp. MUCL 43196]